MDNPTLQKLDDQLDRTLSAMLRNIRTLGKLQNRGAIRELESHIANQYARGTNLSADWCREYIQENRK